jgi:hypothetical protein
MKLLRLSITTLIQLVLLTNICARDSRADLAEIQSLYKKGEKAKLPAKKEKLYKKALAKVQVEESKHPGQIGALALRYSLLVGIELALEDQKKQDEAKKFESLAERASYGALVDKDGLPFSTEEQKAVDQLCDARDSELVVPATATGDWAQSPHGKALAYLIVLEEHRDKQSANLMKLLYIEKILFLSTSLPANFNEYKTCDEKYIKTLRQLGDEKSASEEERNLRKLEANGLN